MNRKIYSTKNFKKGDTVWFCNFEFTPSGKTKNIFRPRIVTIKEVSQDWIEIDDSNLLYGLLSRYNIDTEESNPRFGNYSYNTSLGLHISFTREEAEAKFNKMVEDALEYWYQRFKYIESVLRCKFI